MNTAKRTKGIAALSVCLLIAAAVFAGVTHYMRADAALGEIPVTVTGLTENTVWNYGSNRVRLEFTADKDVLRSEVRAYGANCTVQINGQSFTFNGSNGSNYNVCFGQSLGSDNNLNMLLKHEEGNVSGNNAGLYPQEYPGLRVGEENVIRFFKDSVIGGYKLVNDFAVRISADRVFTFIRNPNELTVVGGTALGNAVYTENGKIMVSEGAEVVLQPAVPVGKRVDSVTAHTRSGEAVVVTENANGNYTLVMPAEAAAVTFTYKDAVDTLTLGATVVQVRPGDVLGALPSGRWAVEGCEISAQSIWIWSGDKTATELDSAEEVYTVTFKNGDTVVALRYYTLSDKNISVPQIESVSSAYTATWEEFALNGGDKTVNAVFTPAEYTVTFMADGEVVATVSLTADSTELQMPTIPYKEGYKILGWDTNVFPRESMVINAVYQKIR